MQWQKTIQYTSRTDLSINRPTLAIDSSGNVWMGGPSYGALNVVIHKLTSSGGVVTEILNGNFTVTPSAVQ